MKCQGCGNPFCNAGPIMKAIRNAHAMLLLILVWVPATLLGRFMPLPWALAGTALYAYAFYRVFMAIGMEAVGKLTAAQLADAKRVVGDVVREFEEPPSAPGGAP